MFLCVVGVKHWIESYLSGFFDATSSHIYFQSIQPALICVFFPVSFHNIPGKASLHFYCSIFYFKSYCFVWFLVAHLGNHRNPKPDQDLKTRRYVLIYCLSYCAIRDVLKSKTLKNFEIIFPYYWLGFCEVMASLQTSTKTQKKVCALPVEKMGKDKEGFIYNVFCVNFHSYQRNHSGKRMHLWWNRSVRLEF